MNASLDSTVIFTCEATDAIAIVFFVDDIAASNTFNTMRGFTELHEVAINGTTKRSLSVKAQENNNNTVIHCTIYPNTDSENATLRVQGEAMYYFLFIIYFSYLFFTSGQLAGVSDLKYTYVNGSSVLLSWTAPYTLDNVPIAGYYINDNDGGLLNTNNLSYLLQCTDPNFCVLNIISVAAINGAGIGEVNNISFYYQEG